MRENDPWTGLLHASDVGCFAALATIAVLVLRSRHDLSRVLVPTLVLLHVAVALFGLSQSLQSWPLAFPRLVPVLYAQVAVLVALTMPPAGRPVAGGGCDLSQRAAVQRAGVG